MGITDGKLGSPLATWTGTFSSEFNTIPFQIVLADQATNGFASNAFAGQITLTPVPEPGTLPFLHLGSGMIAEARFLRRLCRR
jgi:hypothetical protein